MMAILAQSAMFQVSHSAIGGWSSIPKPKQQQGSAVCPCPNILLAAMLCDTQWIYITVRTRIWIINMKVPNGNLSPNARRVWWAWSLHSWRLRPSSEWHVHMQLWWWLFWPGVRCSRWVTVLVGDGPLYQSRNSNRCRQSIHVLTFYCQACSVTYSESI